MTIDRRYLGLGLLAASATATGGYQFLRNNPQIAGHLGEAVKLLGFYGGEKQAFLANPKVKDILSRRHGFALDARRAGSVEMIRERPILDQKPQFLWPSASVLVEMARQSGIAISREQIVLTSPVVLYSWDTVAEGLVKAGYATSAGGPRYRVNLLKLLKAVIAGETWAAVGVPELFGRARIVTTDPNQSNTGFTFAALCASLLAGDVLTMESLAKVEASTVQLFRRMGFKPSSSGKLFDDYIAGGAGAQPLVVAYENQLVEWVLEDPARWQRVEANATAKPVVLYPEPTIFASHQLLSLNKSADGLIDALLSEPLQELAWESHGFRGPLGTVGKARNPLLQSRLLDGVTSVLPMPDAPVMLALLDRLKS
jgi:hypothetical protein